MTYKIKSIGGHFEVYINGKFYCRAKTMYEVIHELKEYAKERGVAI